MCIYIYIYIYKSETFSNDTLKLIGTEIFYSTKQTETHSKWN